jgi:hypothetical protein
MFAGVFVYSFLIGSFTSLFTHMDISRKNIKKMLATLHRLKREHNISNKIYTKTRKFIRSGAEKSVEDYNEFLDQLPTDLFIEVSYMIHKKLEEIEFFSVTLFFGLIYDIFIHRPNLIHSLR